MDVWKSWGLGTTFDCHNAWELLLALNGRRERMQNVLHCVGHSHPIKDYAIPNDNRTPLRYKEVKALETNYLGLPSLAL